MNIRDLGEAPKEHEMLQLCPICAEPFEEGQALARHSRGEVIEIAHEDCLQARHFDLGGDDD
jgi:hypothetical protein